MLLVHACPTTPAVYPRSTTDKTLFVGLTKMNETVTGHPIASIAAAIIPLVVVLAMAWRCRPAIRIASIALGLVWAALASAYLAFKTAEVGEFLDRKNFIFLPVENIIHDITRTADSGDLDRTKAQLREFQRHWNTICLTTNDPWTIQEHISKMKTGSEANK
jgi:hypothetical protein